MRVLLLLTGSILSACDNDTKGDTSNKVPNTDTGTDTDPNTDADGDGFNAASDCDDTTASISPDAPERVGRISSVSGPCAPSEAVLVGVVG
ncbi:MAG: hypothetical protein ACI8RZ_001159 [Myxococcota bacterium]|jgi:hypothetical protein